jgi:hypothetical protein
MSLFKRKTINEKILFKKIMTSNNKDKISEDLSKKESKVDIYKDKYFTLKHQYQQLEEEYQELKLAVDKLLNLDK